MDWSDPKAKVSRFFTVKECLWLPTWSRMAKAEDGLDDSVKGFLMSLCAHMDLVRDLVGSPIRVHVTYRPEAYNKLIGGATNSSHKLGKAMDFDVKGISCDQARDIIKPKLEELGMRMEDLPGSSWVHLDISAPNPNRFFKP